MQTSTRLKAATAFFFIAPFALALPRPAGIVLAISLAHLAWAFATNTTIELALLVLVVLGATSPCAPGDADAMLIQAFCVAFAATVTLSVCCGRVSPTRIFKFVRRGFAQVSARLRSLGLFSAPSAGRSLHAHWFMPGLLLVFLIIASYPGRVRAFYLMEWLVVFFAVWTLRWFFPRWAPASLARMSLFVTAQQLLYFSLHVSPRRAPISFALAMSMCAVAGIWALRDAWTERRLWSGRHPSWVLAEHEGERVILRERTRDEGYRASTQGTVVGSLRAQRGPRREVIATLCVLGQLHIVGFAYWLRQH